MTMDESATEALAATPDHVEAEVAAGVSSGMERLSSSLLNPVFGRDRRHLQTEPGVWSLMAVPVLVCLAMLLFVLFYPTG